MAENKLAEERQILQQVKTSILFKAERAARELERGNGDPTYVRHCYARAAALEMEIVEMFKQEGKEKKAHPGIISAISCYLKIRDLENAHKLLKQYYPKDGKEYSIDIIRELWDGVEDLYRRVDLRKPDVHEKPGKVIRLAPFAKTQERRKAA